MGNNNYDFFFWLSVTANWAQLESYNMNKQQISNDELMKHLNKQDDILDEQTNVYLKKIIDQNEKILKILKGGKSDAHKGIS